MTKVITLKGFEQQDFAAHFAEEMVRWVSEYLSPDQVFSDDELKDYVSNQFAVEDVYHQEYLIEALREDEINPDEIFTWGQIVQWTKFNANPEDVFDTSTLEEWALDNGYVKEGDN